jgi:alpha-L-rhamnosidase
MIMTKIFSPTARWIWNNSDRTGYHYYLRARKTFRASAGEAAVLKITADANYQAWLNGQVVGHGPAKAAEGRLSVDGHDLTPMLVDGENQLDVLVLCIGVGTMTYCPGEAGLIFEVELPGRSAVSDAKTLVQRDPRRQRFTVRRWAMPCIEDVDARASVDRWQPATVVEKSVTLYPRRVPLPSREPVVPQRVVAVEQVELPNFSVSFRVRPYLTQGEDYRRFNHFATPARLVLELDSPVAQTLRFTPTLGAVTWSFNGKKLFTGAGWMRWNTAESQTEIRLRKGINQLIGEHSNNHFDDISLAGFVNQPVSVKGLRIERDGQAIDVPPALEANAQDLVAGADLDPKSDVRRTIYDLGKVHNGWLAFDVTGHKGTRLIFSFFEGLEDGPPLRFQWLAGCNNALTYRLREGWQSFESFFPYGVRYIAVHEVGGPVQLRSLRVLTANCGSNNQGYFRCDDPLLNEIYEACVQTVIAGVDDTFTDCPTYEQVNWNFDNRAAWLGEIFTCANLAVARNSIEVCAEDPRYPGLVRSHYPSTWDSQVPLWSLHWIMWCWDYYQFTGDEAFVRRILPRVAAGIEDGLRKINRDGLLEWPGTWHFVEWGHGRDDDHAINTAEQGGLVGALATAERLAAIIGQPMAPWRTARRQLIRAINRHLWCADKNAYADSRHADGTLSPVCSLATNALLAIYGVAPNKWCKQLARRIAKGDSQLLNYGSPYGLYYVLELLDQQGDVETIFALVRQRWGDMVRAGDKTVWESFPEFGHGDWPVRSRCHPFAAYVVKYFVKYLMGIDPRKPGYATVAVKPQPPKGITTCQGAVPTPRGLLRVAWQQKGRSRNVQMECPPSLKRI